MGVVRKPGEDKDTPLTQLLFHSSAAAREDLRRHYAIYASHLEHLLGRMPSLPPPKVQAAHEIRVEVFPCIDGRHTPETAQVRTMAAGVWTTLVFELRDPQISGVLRIDPACEPCFIEVGDILIHSLDSRELIWSSPASSSGRQFRIAGTALAHPADPSILVSMGDDPVLLLDTPDSVRGPLKLSITLRIIPVANEAMQMMQTHFYSPLVQAGQELQEQRRELTTQRENVAAQLASARAELASSRSQLEARDQALQQTRELLAQEQTRLNDIVNSLSWRVTAPMRRFMAALRSGPHKPRA